MPYPIQLLISELLLIQIIKTYYLELRTQLRITIGTKSQWNSLMDNVHCKQAAQSTGWHGLPSLLPAWEFVLSETSLLSSIANSLQNFSANLEEKFGLWKRFSPNNFPFFEGIWASEKHYFLLCEYPFYSAAELSGRSTFYSALFDLCHRTIGLLATLLLKATPARAVNRCYQISAGFSDNLDKFLGSAQNIF